MGVRQKRAPLPTDADLTAFRLACAAVAGPATTPLPACYSPGEYGPLHNHCLAVAAAVQARWGGGLVHGWIEHDLIDHWWNRLPDGRAVDLTSEQFGGDGLAPPADAAPWTQSYPALVRRVGQEAHVIRFLALLQEPA